MPRPAPATATPRLELTPLEVAAGIPLAPLPRRGRPHGPVARTPLAALEAAVLPALRRGPCCVAFSGGRDSSLVLAAAVRAARRHGLDEPLPVTLRYPHLPSTEESRWQDLVVEHLGVGDHVVVELDDDLDLVGPVAAGGLRRLGPSFPPNAHSIAPNFPYARGGTLLVGLGGDEVLGTHRFTRLNHVLARRRRPAPGDLRWAAAAALPPALRGRLLVDEPPRPWLRPAAARRVAREERRRAIELVRFDRAVASSAGSRLLAVVGDTLRRLAAPHDVVVEAPLLDTGFTATLGAAAGPRGFGGRTATMHAVAGDALPRALVERATKATFDGAFFAGPSRAFAESWDGAGVDRSLVDPEALRAAWLAERPDFRSAMLLQAAWLHADRARTAVAA